MKSSPMSLLEEFIKEAFGSQYVIPVYQRKYTWKSKKQVGTLISDIEKILSNKIDKHFIGTIVYLVIKTDFMVRERAVIDGQQRLVTMFLMIYALRDIANEKGDEELANFFTSNYLENINANENYRHRLRPSVADDNSYLVIAEGLTHKLKVNHNSLIYENYMFIKKSFIRLLNTYDFISIINALRNLHIVRIELDDSDNPQQIFESINSTGEALTAADLIRNFIMMHKKVDIQEKIYNDYWLTMENIFVNNKDFEEFFRLYIATKTYTLVSKKELYSSFKEYWNSRCVEEEEFDILNEIKTHALYFDELYYQKDCRILDHHLSDFKKMQSLMPAPFMMKVLDLYYTSKIDLSQFREVTKLINTFLIRRYMMGQDTSAITRFFPTCLKNVLNYAEVYGHDKFVQICKKFIVNDTRQKSSFMPDDEQLIEYLKTANSYSLNHTRWLFEKIENHHNSAKVDLDNLSIEHIMPQKSNEYWEEVSELDEENYIHYVNRLGNLTLASKNDNSRMSNNDFTTKKAILKKTSHIRLNESILEKEIWRPQDIDERTKKLTLTILGLFPYEKTTMNFKNTTREISLHRAELFAEGYLHEDNKLEVYKGCKIRINIDRIYDSTKKLRDKLLEENYLVFEDNECVLVKNYIFSSPSAATDFIVGGSNNGWDAWKDENGDTINHSLRSC